MAIVPKFCITNKTDCKTLAVYDTTGIYSAGNTGGYGSPNDAIGDITDAILSLSKRNTDGTFTALNDVTVFPTLPNLTNTPYLLTSSDFGLEAGIVIPDGIYMATYTVFGNSRYENAKTFVQYCSIQCCFKKLSDKAAAETCGKDTKQRFSEMSILMRGLEAAIGCGDLITIQNLLTYLTKFCTNCGCGCS